MEKNHSVFFSIIFFGILIFNPFSFYELPTSFAQEDLVDTEVIVGNSLELSFLLAKEPEPNEIQIEFNIKHGNDEIEISTISFKKDTEEIIFDKNKYFETAYADFYFDDESIEVVFQIYFAKAIQITGFTVTAIDLNGNSSEINVDKSINVKHAKKSITLHSIAEYNFQETLIREPLLSTEYTISPNPNGGENLHVIDGGLNDDDGKNDGSIIISQLPVGLYTVIVENNEIIGPHEIDLISLEPPKTLNVGTHSFNPSLTYVFREPVKTGLEEPQIIDANFGEEFDDLVESGACLVDPKTEECIPITDPNQLSFAIVGNENFEAINDLEPIEIVIGDQVISGEDFLIVDAEKFLPCIETPDSSQNQATLLPTLSIDDKKSESLYAFSSCVTPEDIKDNAIIIKINDGSYEKGKGGFHQAIIRGSETLDEGTSEKKSEIFSFKSSPHPGKLNDGTTIPRLPSLDNFLGISEDTFEIYMDVGTRFEQNDSTKVNWHDPDNFEVPPTIRIIIPAVPPEDVHTDEHSGYEVFSMDENDPMYLIPKPIIFMLDETVSPPQWIQDDVKIFHQTCERISDDHAICDAEIPHYSRFGVGGVKSLALGHTVIQQSESMHAYGFNIDTLDFEETFEEIIEQNRDEILNQESLDENQNVENNAVQINNDGEFESVKIPSWFKQPALWWISGIISDDEFKENVKYLYESEIIKFSKQSSEKNVDIVLIKNNVWDWIDGYADEDDMLNTINLLINDEIDHNDYNLESK